MNRVLRSEERLRKKQGLAAQGRDSANQNLLNPAQKRSLTVALRLLEGRLNEIEAFFSADKSEGILFTIEHDLTAEQIENLRGIFSEIREKIVRARERFNLTPEREKLSHIVAGSTSYFWSILADKTAKKMERYGSVSPDLSAVLDPMVGNLNELLNDIRRILNSSE